MTRWLAIFVIAAVACVQANKVRSPNPEAPVLCSDSWYRMIEEKVTTSDDQRHGPDVGSDEWKSAIEFKLGIRGREGLSSRNSEAWCRYIDQVVRRQSRTLSVSGQGPGKADLRPEPSYACDKAAAGSIEAMICGNRELSALDRILADVYAAASRKATRERPPLLKAEQRGWIKGRNECWKSNGKRGCVRDEYRRRIAGLQAGYRLVPGEGPIGFVCGHNPADVFSVAFFRTDPPTLIAEHGDSASLMYSQPSGSGPRYQGRNESFWEHRGEALIRRGHDAPEMDCRKVP